VILEWAGTDTVECKSTTWVGEIWPHRTVGQTK